MILESFKTKKITPSSFFVNKLMRIYPWSEEINGYEEFFDKSRKWIVANYYARWIKSSVTFTNG